MTTSIGRRWKHGDMCSRAVLIARKLAHRPSAVLIQLYTSCFLFDRCSAPSQHMSYQFDETALGDCRQFLVHSQETLKQVQGKF